MARIFAAELAVPYTLQVVRDLTSLELEMYGGNPALKVPSMQRAGTTWFGALNICRELARVSSQEMRIVWPETLDLPLLANMQELVLHGMATEVGLIMSGVPEASEETSHRRKLRSSLSHTLSWLDRHLEPALAALPKDRELSYLETCLFCLVTHLDFRQVLPSAPFPELVSFAHGFGTRASCVETPFRFDT